MQRRCVMRRPTAVVGLAVFLAANLGGCSEQPAPTQPHRMAASESPLMDAAAEHAGAIVGHDSCDPDSFNEVLQDPTACVKPGRTTFDEFIAELQATKVARSWRFNPLQATAHRGDALLAINVGGETHTFTPVKKFGGGFIGILNTLSGNPVPAPECLNVPGLD